MGIIHNITNNMAAEVKRSVFSRMVDQTDKSVSTTNIFTITLTIVGIVLLIVPIVAITVDLIYNHTVTMSWSDIAVYIGADVSIFTVAGITKASTNYAYAKYGNGGGDGPMSDPAQFEQLV